MFLTSLCKCESFSLSFAFPFLNANHSHSYSGSQMITILIQLLKCESISLSFAFRQAGQLPCAFVQIRHLPPRITCQRVCANPTIFGSVQIRWQIFFICANPTMNFPKNSGRLVLRTNPAVYVQIRHEFARRQIYGFRNIFMASMRGCVIV